MKKRIRHLLDRYTPMQVQRSPRQLFTACPILLIVMLILIINRKIILSILPLCILIFVILTYINDKLTYDDAGITFHNLYKQKRFISWDNIVSIEDVWDDPTLSRGNPARILRIVYVTKYQNTQIARFSFTGYTGLHELLFYYYNRKKVESHEEE